MRIFLFMLVLLLFSCAACIKKDNKEDKPVIQLLSPLPCDTLYFGEPFMFQIKVSDKDGLGNLKMDIHNNFGQHQHGDHAPCNMDSAKIPVKPYFEEWIFALPDKEKEYVFETNITFPDENFDKGDYHFHIYVTDNVGYQSFITLSVKVLER
jgi:hypothetical protein